jgi:XTP/dITP diphosphohydrolase
LVYFATGNKHKFEEARFALGKYAIRVVQIKQKGLEIQSNSLETIAKSCVLNATKRFSNPIFVEDAGLFIKALSGFPGPYSSYVYQTLGISGILKLTSCIDDRSAEFRSVIAFCDTSGNLRCFDGVIGGRISSEARGIGGFGFDPIFEPDNENGKTFAEMSVEEKSLFSHRGIALRKFAKWYAKYLRNHTL